MTTRKSLDKEELWMQKRHGKCRELWEYWFHRLYPLESPLVSLWETLAVCLCAQGLLYITVSWKTLLRKEWLSEDGIARVLSKPDSTNIYKMPFPHSWMALVKGRKGKKIFPDELIKACGRWSGFMPSQVGGVRRPSLVNEWTASKGVTSLHWKSIVAIQISHEPKNACEAQVRY